MAATMDGEDRVMATAQHILKALGPKTDLTNDMISILSTFDQRFSISNLIPAEDTSETQEEQEISVLESCEEIILGFEDTNSRDPLRWEDDPSTSADYLWAVDQILDLTLSGGKTLDSETLDQADTLLQTAMARLEDEFRHILVRNAAPLDAAHLFGSIEGSGDESDASVELIRSDTINFLIDIVGRMVHAGYDKECCQAYIVVRRDALDECLLILGVDRMSIEEVQRIEWRELDEKMKKWAQAVKIVVCILSGERRLCDRIFEAAEAPIRENCFTESARGCIVQLLNFAEAVSICRPASEKLFRILDMYDALAGASPELEALFPAGNMGEFVCSEVEAILAALGNAIKSTLAEFENAVRRETSHKAMQGGDIHPLTRYVMNYIKLLVDYRELLNSILDESSENSSDCPDNSLDEITPIGYRLLSLISYLESNLEEKSKVYEDLALQYVFLMNNIHYIVHKIKDSDLRPLFGDQWVRKRRGQIRQLATSYLRASWTKVLSCFKEDGLGSGGSLSNASKTGIKERFKNFNLGFEEIYRNQTGWKVSDPQLREELRLSVSDRVIPAYRSFVGRYGYHLESGRNAGKYIKYSADDIENLVLDLFEGSPGSLNHPRRKLSM